MLKLITVAIALAACADKAPPPPPIAQGKCLVDRYVGTTPIQQACTYVGYSWSCTWLTASNLFECNRGDEAVGERAK